MAGNSGYVIIHVTFAGGLLDETYQMARSTVSIDGPWTILGEHIPLLGERAVYTDTTAPIGVPLWYRIVSDQTGNDGFSEEAALPALGQVWLKDPLRPWADIPMDFCDVATSGHVQGCTSPDPEFVWVGLGQGEWEADTGLFPVLNAEYPADVWARRKFENNSLRFFTKTLDAIDRVYDLFTAGGPLLLQLPDEYGWHDHYIQPGAVTRNYISRDQRRPERVWDVPFTVVDRPLGPGQGTECANWCAVQDAFPTYGDFVTAPGTFEDLLAGDVLCPGGVPADAITDTFERTVANGWGTADTGQVWTVRDGPATDFSVAGGTGRHVLTAPGIFHITTLPWTVPDSSLRVDFSLSALPVTDSAYVFPVVQYADTTHLYMARVQISGTGGMFLTLRKRDGAETQLGSAFTTALTFAPGAWYTVRLNRTGTTLQGKVWLRGTPEPAWQVTVTDATFTGVGDVGVRSFLGAAATNAPLTFSFDNLWVAP
jgi:hypothetical protein